VSDVKTYAQNCPVAVALDAIGDRWTLLILRELAFGDQRFTDLRNALPGIAPNLLSARLAELGDRGLVTRAELPPPAARSVYRLTARGEGVRPVLGALARFGVPDLPRDPERPMRPLGSLLTLLSAWYRGPQEGLGRVRVTIDGTPFLLALGERVDVVPDTPGVDAPPPDLEVEFTSAALVAARQDRTPPQATYHGPRDAVTLFTRAFALGREAGEDVDGDLTKAEASEKIEELQEKTGRGA
jgi:DNA-binding HxlR family transcriptional regulator